MRLYNYLQLVLFVILSIGYNIECIAQVNLDIEGHIVIQNTSPALFLFDSSVGENREEGAIFESNDNIFLSSTRGDLHLSSSTTGALTSSDLTILGTNGYVGIGTMNPVSQLDVNGSVRIANNSRLTFPTSTSASEIFMLGNNLWLGNFTTGKIALAFSPSPSTPASARFTATYDGVGILTTSPNEPLEVAGSGRAFFGDGGGSNRKGLLIDGDGGSLGTRIESFDYAANTGMNLRINTIGGGKVGIGISTPTNVLHINGVGRSSQSTWATSSDRRVKQNIRSVDNALEKISALNPVIFDWIESYKKTNPQLNNDRYGFIAQEVKQVVPQMVSVVEEKFDKQTIDDFNILNTDALFPLLVKALQEQQALIESQNVLIDEIQSRLSKIENERTQ